MTRRQGFWTERFRELRTISPEGPSMFKVILWLFVAIFVIGLLVVIGVLDLVF